MDFYLFDFDGLLVDTEKVHFRAYQLMMENHGHPIDWDFRTYCEAAHIGASGIRDKIYQSYQFPNWEDLREEKQQIYQSLIKEGRVSFMPGAEKVLTYLQGKGFPHGIVTNSTKKQVEAIMQHLPLLTKIPFWITRDDVQNPKPSPEPYLVALKRYAQNCNAIGFEDTSKGVEALTNAGIPAILICSPDHPQLEQKIPYLEHFNDLSEFHRIYHCK